MKHRTGLHLYYDRPLSRSVLSVLFCLVALLVLSSTPADPLVLLLDSFEDGVGQWRTNDSTVAGTDRLARLCGIYVTSDTPPRGGGAQAAMIDFRAGEGAWASVSLPVDGSAWAAAEAGQLEMWLKGRQGQDQSVDVTLRASVPGDNGDPEDRSYISTVKLDGDDWRKLTLRFFGFKTENDEVLTRGLIEHIYLLQFVKTGTWQPLRFDIDDLRVAPAPTPVERPAAERETIIINFDRDLGRVLGQVGFNLRSSLPATVSDREVLKRLSRNTADLAPCVGRIPLADYGAALSGEALGVINRNVNWLLDLGVRPMIAFYARPTEENPFTISPGRIDDFAALARLRKGTQNRPYYELCTAPIPATSETVQWGIDRYNDAAEVLTKVDPTMRLGGPCFLRPSRDLIEKFAEGATDPHFFSYACPLEPKSPVVVERLSDMARYGTSQEADVYDYQAIRSGMQAAPRRPELYITDWGIRRTGPPVGPGASAQAGAYDAVFLATGALNATRWVDKLLWHRLIDDNSGLVDKTGQPRAPYYAAWLINTYAPRGASCRAIIPYSSDTFIAAVQTQTASNVFVINWSREATMVSFRALGIEKPTAVREHRLDPADQEVIQHRNRGANFAQTVNFEGPGLTVIQFITPQDTESP